MSKPKSTKAPAKKAPAEKAKTTTTKAKSKGEKDKDETKKQPAKKKKRADNDSSDEATTPQPKKKKAKGTKEGEEDNRPYEEIYQKKTPLEHILLRPDTYIGSVERQTQAMWVYDEGVGMNFRTITYVPGLYKIFDEILVNAADNYQRDNSMDELRVTIDPESNTISVWNNGQGRRKKKNTEGEGRGTNMILGIPVEIHSEHKVYIPEMIFGELLTSSNYDDSKKKVTGGAY